MDIAPSAANGASCTALWNSVTARADELDQDADAVCGSPAWGEIPLGFRALAFRTDAAEQARLTANPQQAPANPATFAIHINLVPV